MAGDLIVGSGGCRKIRIPGKGRGKSGGYCVVTYFASEDIPVFMLSVLSKGSRANFNRAELNGMAIAVKNARGRPDWKARKDTKMIRKNAQRTIDGLNEPIAIVQGKADLSTYRVQIPVEVDV